MMLEHGHDTDPDDLSPMWRHVILELKLDRDPDDPSHVCCRSIQE